MQLYLLYLQIIPTFVPNKSNPIINKTSTAVMKRKLSCSLLVYWEHWLSAPVRRTFMMKVNNPRKKRE